MFAIGSAIERTQYKCAKKALMIYQARHGIFMRISDNLQSKEERLTLMLKLKLLISWPRI